LRNRQTAILFLLLAQTLPAASLKDGMGREITPRRLPAKRIISLAPNVTEILFAIGAGNSLVGRDRYSQYPPECAKVKVVGTDLEPSIETIVSLRPDVIITATSANRQETVSALERLSLPVYATRSQDIETLLATIRGLGDLCGRKEAAKRLVAELASGIQETRRRVAGLSRPKTLVVVWNDPLYVAAKGSFPVELVTAAGGAGIVSGASVPFPKYSLEKVLHAGPEVILIGSHKGGNVDAAAYWNRWSDLPAVRDGRVHLLDGDLLFRPGPRLLEALDLLVPLLHPERKP